MYNTRILFLLRIVQTFCGTLVGLTLAAGAFAETHLAETAPVTPEGPNPELTAPAMEPLPEIFGLGEDGEGGSGLCWEEWDNDLVTGQYVICTDVRKAERPEDAVPDLHLDVALEASAGGVEGRFLTPVTVTVSNRGSGESAAQSVEVAFSGRHATDPNGEIVAMEIAVAVADSAANCSPKKDSDLSRRKLTCGLPALAGGGSRNLHFLVSAPPAGMLAWRAALSAEDHHAEGLVNVRPPSGTAPPMPEAKIIRVVTAEQQVGFHPLGGPATYYPFSPTRTETGGEDRRRLLVIGTDLPKTGVDVELSSGDPLIAYRFIASAETADRRELRYTSPLGSALKRFYRDPEGDPVAMLDRLQAAGFEMVFLDARFAKGILPGQKKLVLNGASGNWMLDFGDIELDLHFVRRIDGDASAGEAVGEDRIVEAYQPESVELVAAINPKHLPLRGLTAVIGVPNPESGGSTPFEIELTPMADEDQLVLTSKPLAITTDPPDLGEIGLFQAHDPEDLTHVLSQIDSADAEKFLPRALGVETTLEILAPNEGLFHQAMIEAAACHQIDLPQRNWRKRAHDHVASLENTLILKAFETLRQDVSLGHHAAYLMLRDAWMDMAKQQERELHRIETTPDLLRKKLLGWRTVFNASDLAAPVSPVFKIEIDDLGPKQALGAPISFGNLMRFERSIRDTFRAAGVADAETLTWIEAAGRQAVRVMRQASIEARKEVNGHDRCDLEELVELGKGLDLVGESLTPQLVRRDNDTERWRPDLQGRRWVASAINVANAYETQTELSEFDTNVVMGIVSVALFPLAALEGATVGALALGASAAEFTVQSALEISAYTQSQQELARAFGLSLVIGDARYDRAKAQEKTLAGLIGNLGLNALSMGADGLGFAHTLRVARGADVAKRVTTAADVLSLSKKQASDFEAYMADIVRIRSTKGPEALTDRQRNLDNLIHRHSQTPLTPVRPRQFVPKPIARPRDAPFPLARSPGEGLKIVSFGQSREGIRRLMPYIGSNAAPARALSNDPAEQLLLDGLDTSFSKILAGTKVDTVEHIVIRQTLETLRESKGAVIFKDDLGDLGLAFFDPNKRRFTIALNPEKMDEAAVFGVRWTLPALYGHESGHMIQFTNEKTFGNTIGRGLKEYDSTLRMSLIQNSHDAARGLKPSISPEQAVEISMHYGLDTQWLALRPDTLRGPFFNTKATFANGLFQLDHVEAVARAQMFFPQMGELEILDIYLNTQKRIAGLHAPAVGANPLIDQLSLRSRYNAMIQAAEVRKAKLELDAWLINNP